MWEYSKRRKYIMTSYKPIISIKIGLLFSNLKPMTTKPKSIARNYYNANALQDKYTIKKPAILR